MADQVLTNLAKETSVETKSLQADTQEKEEEMSPEPQKLIVRFQVAPEPDIGTIKPRHSRLRKTARKTITRRQAIDINWYEGPLGFDPLPPPPSPIKKQIESKGENSVSEKEPMEMEPEPSEQSMDDTAQSKFTLTFASAAEYPGPCPHGNCGWLDD